MIRLQFYSALTFESFLADVASALGSIPGTVRESESCLVLTQQEYEDDSVDLVELVRDYSGRVVHQK